MKATRPWWQAPIASNAARGAFLAKVVVWVMLVPLGGACSAGPIVPGPGAAPSYAVEPTEQTRIASRLAPRLAEHPGESGFVLLHTGMEAFVARMGLARAADRTLDVQTYILRPDDSGRLMMQALLEAADRGVRVRLLLDDQNLAGMDDILAILDAHEHLAVRLFNPYTGRSLLERVGAYFTDFTRVTRRMHNKLFAADNTLAIVGGRNVGDEYFQAGPELDFLDLDVMALGPVVEALSAQSFDAYWNSEWVVPVDALTVQTPTPADVQRLRESLAAHADAMRSSGYAEAVRDTPLARQIRGGTLAFVWAPAEVVADHPGKAVEAEAAGLPLVYEQLLNVTRRTERELVLISPYFVPGREGVDFLASLREQGVAIRILTNSLASTDSIAAYAGYQGYRRDLLEAGVALYEMKSSAPGDTRLRDASVAGSAQASLHAKTYVFDGRRLFIGSLNLDPRSFWINTETGLFIQSEALSQQVVARFEAATSPERSYALRLEAVPPDRHGFPSRPQLVWETEEAQELVRYYSDPEVSVPRRTATFLLRLLPIEDQL